MYQISLGNKVTRQGKNKALPMSDALAEQMRSVALQGISVYLDTLYRRVPVWSGRLQRSFYPLAERLRDVGVNRKAGPPSGVKRGPTSAAREWFERNGAPDEYGDVDDITHKYTKFRLPRRGSKKQFSFTFINEMDYFAENDTNPAAKDAKGLKHETPWNAQRDAIFNMQSYINLKLPRVVKYSAPKMFKAIVTGNYEITGVKGSSLNMRIERDLLKPTVRGR